MNISATALQSKPNSPSLPATQEAPTLPPTPEQAAAIDAIAAWAASPTSGTFFVLKAPAGCGKTFCVKHLVSRIKGRMVFTAPTNKATKVLRQSLTSDRYRPDCRTIYSLLGLSLSADGEVKELKQPEEPIDLSEYRLVVVDEGSMLNSVVMGHLRNTAESFALKVLFLGDPAQLPPVKEASSPIWSLPDVVTLTKVMRHDNQILTFATQLRHLIDCPAGMPVITSSNTNGEGIWSEPAHAFHHRIALAADLGQFSSPDLAKVIAWRNVTVDTFNTLIRRRIFPDSWHTSQYHVGDRVLFTAPASDLEDKPLAKIDDEGTVMRVAVSWHPSHPEFKVFELAITLDDGKPILARALHPDSERAYTTKLTDLAAAARDDRRKWRHYWDFKETFHQLRYAYAITAHRSQGSTYDTAFVNYRDILVNRDRAEALRCLYVAATRPRKQLILG